jgi:Na+-transporting methylmalonyl-CoA/oxaloacetate decarboxylase gamma subunit
MTSNGTLFIGAAILMIGGSIAGAIRPGEGTACWIMGIIFLVLSIVVFFMEFSAQWKLLQSENEEEDEGFEIEDDLAAFTVMEAIPSKRRKRSKHRK